MKHPTTLDALIRHDRIMPLVRVLWRSLLAFRLPVIRPIFGVLYAERDLRHTLLPLLLKVLYREPLLRYRATSVGRRLHISGPLPLIIGAGEIVIGDDVFLNGHNTWVVGHQVSEGAQLVIGNRVMVGYRTSISVAVRVEIGDDTKMGSRVCLFDNIGHPLSPARRLRGESFTLEEAAPIVIGRNCQISTGAMIMRGVTIGDGAIVAAGAIVTRDVPANSLVAGNPAKVKKTF